MAFYDWNGNGKNDLEDDLIEYNIYKNCTDNNNSNNNSGCGCCCGPVLGILGVLIMIIATIGAIIR